MRGESVVSIAVESPPAASKKPAKRTALEADLQAGMAGVPAGRGSGAGVPPVAEVAPVLPLPGLPPGAVPPHGVPPIAVMQPQLSSDPRLYGPPPVAGAPPFARGAPIVPAVPPIPPFPHGGPAPNAMPMPPPQVAYGRGMVSYFRSHVNLYLFLLFLSSTYLRDYELSNLELKKKKKIDILSIILR